MPTDELPTDALTSFLIIDKMFITNALQTWSYGRKEAMIPDPKWSNKDSSFWAYVRLLSEKIGYAKRGADQIRKITKTEMVKALKDLGRNTEVITDGDLGDELEEYFSYRADLLNDYARDQLMNVSEAMEAFEKVVSENTTGERIVQDPKGKQVAIEYDIKNGLSTRVPMNKQKDAKRLPAYLTGIVNILVSKELAGLPFDSDPRNLAVVDYNGKLHATMSRRLDGAFPSTINPIALWELKEYYHTTTFGSKISDAVYITQLDGHEIEAIKENAGISIANYLMVDAKATWWDKGKSYLCRLVDLLNQSSMTELLIGRECLTEIPRLVTEWKAEYEARPENKNPDFTPQEASGD